MQPEPTGVQRTNEWCPTEASKEIARRVEAMGDVTDPNPGERTTEIDWPAPSSG